MDQIIIQDFAVIPALHDDCGHYLLMPNKEALYVEKNLENWRKRIVDCPPEKRFLSYVEIVDKNCGIFNMIDQLVREDGKFRIYLSPNRITQHCSKDLYETFESFCGRTVLGTLKKRGLSHLIHLDFAFVGIHRIAFPEKKQRQKDLSLIKKTRAILSGTSFLKPNARFISVTPKTSYNTPFFMLGDEQQKKKEKYAEELKDVSNLWHCGLKRRKDIREKGVFSWDDPNFEEVAFQIRFPRSKLEIAKKMIRLSNRPEMDYDFPPKSILQEKFSSYFEMPIDQMMFVDFETDYEKCIYLFGYTVGSHGYKSEWATDLCPTKELLLMHKIYDIVQTHKNRGGKVVYFYAEDQFWKERCTLHQLWIYRDLFSDGIDLCKVFTDAPLLIQGVFNFKLKPIAKALYEKGYISISQPDGCANGEESIRIAKRWFGGHKVQDKEVLERYNQFDCDVLLEMTRFLHQL